MPEGVPIADSAIQSEAADDLERLRFAQLIADEAVEAPSAEGFVVGITGAWGLGKTSVLNLVERSIGDRAMVIRFNPWLFSSTDQLIVRFFAEVADTLGRTDEGQSEEEGGAGGRVARRMAAYGAALVPVAGLLVGPLAPLLGVPHAIAEAGQRAAGRVAGPSAHTLHADLAKSLAELDHKLVVFVDDFDRLTGTEVREVVRLVKLVADLPNVVYILAYDRPRVERALGSDGDDGRGEGREYLEKIVQSPHAVSPIAPARLRRLTDETLRTRLGDTSLPHFDANRWAALSRILFGYVTTVRDAKRYANAAAADLRAVDQEVAGQDVLALAALRLFEPDVHAALPRLFGDLTGGTNFDLRDDRDVRAEILTRIEATVKTGTHPDTTRELLGELFIASPLSSASRQVAREWRAKRMVAHPSVLDAYLYATVGPDTVPYDLLAGVLDAMDDPDALRDRIAALADDRLADLFERVRDYPDRFRTADRASVAAEFLRATSRLPSSDGVYGGPGSLTVTWVLQDLLVGSENLAEAVTSLFDQAETLSAQMRVVDAFATWTDEAAGSNADNVRLSVEETRGLENRLLDGIVTADEETLAAEPDLAGLAIRASLAPTDDIEQRLAPAMAHNDLLFLSVLKACVVHYRGGPEDRYELKAERYTHVFADRAGEMREHALRLLSRPEDLVSADRRALQLLIDRAST